ncbi:hypothetical protein G647_07929 [Cladophialophora carrionii CBS 160.54]|uniref:Uncharacterized protein n=1 Tax=Cladophialophora carrionii CBS 160.54 TaxID=1279043 RepID=V9D6G8_9EURO|nr:uncharacterized protein G647_07929 [Cladophialophora carrionii CBS 160.54]ETI21582.1 hypothetical protein G647_07929 [Cladophialophora carrionii CBS 160.54]
MAHIRRQDAFDDSDYVSCPVGGEWWKCEDVNYPTFIGCCSSNPCSGQMCPEEDLYPLGFGSVTAPTPDYPNHSCPYGGLWYTCAANTVPFQGCCESNPCNGQGCPASDLRAAAVHTVVVAGTSTFTVPSSVATKSPTTTTSTTDTTTTSEPTGEGSTSASSESVSESIDVAAIAGGAAAVTVVLTIILGVLICWLVRRKRMRLAEINSAQAGTAPQDPKPFYKDPFGAIISPLPRYSRRPPSFGYSQAPFSPAPTYQSAHVTHPPHTEPQEVMGLGLSEVEFNRRAKSRSPANHHVDGPIELATQRFSATNPEAEAKSPLLEARPKQKPKPNSRAKRENEDTHPRQSRLRSRAALVDLRAQASRSPSRGPAEGFGPND